MKTIEEIRRLMVDGEIVRAGEAAKELLDAEPDNLQAKMLYGTCRQLLGDEETFRRIHDELAPKMEEMADVTSKIDTAAASAEISLWRKYHALWLSLIAGGLVIAAAAGAGVWYVGKVVAMGEPASAARALYGGPRYVSRSLYGGPPRDKLYEKKFSDVQ